MSSPPELPPTERAAFEKALGALHPSWTFEGDGTEGGYHYPRTEAAWQGWQAAQEAAVQPEPVAQVRIDAATGSGRSTVFIAIDATHALPFGTHDLYAAQPITPPADLKDGWVMVPKEPTDAMLIAGSHHLIDGPAGSSFADEAGNVWRAMLSALPKSQE